MTTRLSCEDARQLAPELALGIISGDERAELIAHTASCQRCRSLIESLSITADRILLVAPEHEPPAGFESGVLARMGAPGRTRRPWWLVAAAAVVAAVIAAGSLWLVTKEDREIASHYQAALAEADGEYFGVKPVLSGTTKVGNTFAYQGSPSWLFVVFDPPVDDGTYRVEVTTASDGVLDLGSFELDAGKRTWGTDLDVDLKEVTTVRFAHDSGEVLVVRF